MTRLGPGPFTDPAYVSDHLIPRRPGLDIGNEANPFKELHVEEATFSGNVTVEGTLTTTGGESSTGNQSITNGDLLINTVGKSIKIKAGTNGKGGTFVANGSTAVVIANTSITANSVVVVGLKTVGGTPADAPFMSAVIPGTSFSMKAAVGDTSTYNYMILDLQ